MKTLTEILFYAPRGGSGVLLRAAGCIDVGRVEEGSFNRDHTSVQLDDTDERIAKLLHVLALNGVNPTIIREDFHTEEEFAHARLIYLYGNTSWKVDGERGWDAMFDISGTCPGCCSGARQTVPYLLPASDVPRLEGHRVVTSYWDHILIDERLAEALVATGATGLSFHHVYAVTKEKRQMKLRWKQLASTHTLPRMSKRTTGLSRPRPCPLCERNCYCGSQSEPLRIAYRAADLPHALDVNNTWEGFGYSSVEEDGKPSQLSVPGILVTPKVWRVFRDAGVTEVDFLPIRVVED